MSSVRTRGSRAGIFCKSRALSVGTTSKISIRVSSTQICATLLLSLPGGRRHKMSTSRFTKRPVARTRTAAAAFSIRWVLLMIGRVHAFYSCICYLLTLSGLRLSSVNNVDSVIWARILRNHSLPHHKRLGRSTDLSLVSGIRLKLVG